MAPEPAGVVLADGVGVAGEPGSYKDIVGGRFSGSRAAKRLNRAAKPAVDHAFTPRAKPWCQAGPFSFGWQTATYLARHFPRPALFGEPAGLQIRRQPGRPVVTKAASP